MKNHFFAIVVLLTISLNLQSQDLVTFKSSDSLLISADLYENDSKLPYIIMFHQAESSRGEYLEIAKRIQKLGYNCLAVDLRSGLESNFVKNETAKLATAKGVIPSFIDAKKDMEAAINYVYKKSNKKVILMGSSYSASLSLILAKENENVRAVVAYSPGEFFKPHLIVSKEIKGLNKPTYIACSQREFPYLKEISDAVTAKKKVFFKPQIDKGEHGAKSLWTQFEVSKEYWMSLVVFLNENKE
jgi:dienelactone hydrolase